MAETSLLDFVDGYEIPKEDMLNFLGREDLSHSTNQAMIQLAESDEEYNFYDYPMMEDILEKIKRDELKYYISNESIKREIEKAQSEGRGHGLKPENVGGIYVGGNVMEDDIAQESYMSPDKIFLKEPKVNPDVLRGIDKDWYMGESVFHPMSSYGTKRAGFAETIPHETMHSMISGKPQYGHDKFTQDDFDRAIQSRIIPTISGYRDGALYFPKEGYEGTPSWQELEDMYYAYKDWLFRGRGLSERTMESFDE